METSHRFSCAAVLIDEFLARLTHLPERVFGPAAVEHVNVIRSVGNMAMEIISNSDALYHDVEHSIMVTLVGQEMLRGRHLLVGDVTPEDWVHFIVALLCHDIGYVRGICPGDKADRAVIDADGNTIPIPPGASDAFLTPHHVERGKLFVRWRFRDHPLIKAEVVCSFIERTRFPVPERPDEVGHDWPGLVSAADLLGQMADPDYLRKLPALFHEFEETGANARLGHNSPDDLRSSYPAFYWSMVSKQVAPGMDFLRVTREGRQWISNVYAHIANAA